MWPTLRFQMRAILFVCLAGVIVVTSDRHVERIGDKLQIALPLIGLGCAIGSGSGVQYFGRYLLLEAGIKIPKFTLGDAPINVRPDGGLKGFPSGHTAVSTFGATALAQSCMSQSKVAQGVVLLAAGYVGGSRIESDKHTVWQVMAGALWGWFVAAASLTAFDRLTRKGWGHMVRGYTLLRQRLIKEYAALRQRI